MKRLVRFTLSILLLCFLVACGAKQYEVTTKSGTTHKVYGPWEMDMKTETYTFKDEKGSEIRFKKDDVDVIIEKNK